MIFIEDGHIYQQDDKRFSSVTTILHQLEKVKDWDAIAKKYAKKHGKTVGEVKEEWKSENDKSIVRGKEYHGKKQNQLNSQGFVRRKNVDCNVKFYISSGGQLIQPDFHLDDNTVYTEFMVWDEESGICGTADEVEVINGTINVNDHKTNKEIVKEGFYIPKVGREKLLFPVAHLDACNWNIYCLQLSLYMYLLWKRNKHLKIGELTLNHVEFDEEGRPTKVHPHKVPYLRKEVKDILDWWKKPKVK